MMKRLFALFLVSAIASSCAAQVSSQTPGNSPSSPQAENPNTPSGRQPFELAYVHFNVNATSGPFATSQNTGLQGWYSYDPTTRQIIDLQFIDQANNDISSSCRGFTLPSSGLGLNGVCELPGGSYEFGNAAHGTSGEQAFSYFFDAGSGGEGIGSVSYNRANSPANLPIQTGNAAPSSSSLLQVGTVQSLVTGDLLCYATLLDENNAEHQLGASFELCADASQYLNRKVSLSYTEANVNDCQSIEPCGKTRRETIVNEMQILQ